LPVVFTYAVEHPELQCLVTWARLERRVGPTAHAHRTQSHVHQPAAIEAVPRNGQVPTNLTPQQILTLIESILVIDWRKATAARIVCGITYSLDGAE